jgi:multiple sugar transport system ATP-binding protein
MATRIAVMNAGVIQQVGTPDEIYEAPENLFVAQFIGSPAMNMLTGALRREGNGTKAILPETGTEADLSGYPFRQTPMDGTEIVLGLRPEHFMVNPPQPNGSAVQLELPVRYTEKTGSDATAFLQSADGLLAVRVDPAEVGSMPAGSTLKVGFPGTRLNVFEARSGQRM